MVEQTTTRPSESLTDDTLLEMYWTILLARRVDERAWVLHRQGRIAFHISGMGHEALQVATAFAINRGVDYVHPYYRDLALVLALGVTPRDFMISLFGKAGELSSQARQMPSHWSAKQFHILSSSSPVATQVPQAAGLAFAIKYKWDTGYYDPADPTKPRLALTCLGEGSTSQGEWHEGMNWAGVHKLPFICLVQNNNYAISVPLGRQMGINNVAERAKGYGVHGVTVNGNDVFEVYDSAKAAAERAYSGEGASLIEAKCYRITPHSSDDDDRTYRPREEIEEAKRADPLLRFQGQLKERGILTAQKEEEFEVKARKMVDEALHDAEALPYPDEAVMYGDLYATD